MDKTYLYVLIDANSGVEYGYTLDEQKAREKANEIESEKDVQIDIYEFAPYEKF